jgi:hypothetical protein
MSLDHELDNLVDNRLNPPKLNTPTGRGHRDRRTRDLKLRAGAPDHLAPGDLLLSTWHTLGRSRDDIVSITSQPRAPLQFT